MKQWGRDVETCFADIKGNQLFRRLHLRGLTEVKTELALAVVVHNMRKMQIDILKKAA
jgi:hypothetical protein